MSVCLKTKNKTYFKIIILIDKVSNIILFSLIIKIYFIALFRKYTCSLNTVNKFGRFIKGFLLNFFNKLNFV